MTRFTAISPRTCWTSGVPPCSSPRRGHDSTLEWLQQAPRRRLKGLWEQLGKVRLLLSLQVERYPLNDIRLERQRGYARQMRRRRPSRFQALREPRRTLEMVCFLRMTLLQSTDVVLSMADRLIQDLHARTTQDVQEAEGRRARSVRQSLHAIHRMLGDPTIPDGMLRQAILALMPSAHIFFPSRAAAIRGKLSEHARHVRPLVKLPVGLTFEGEAHAPLLTALSRSEGSMPAEPVSCRPISTRVLLHAGPSSSAGSTANGPCGPSRPPPCLP